MHVLIKALISVGIILAAAAMARRLPSTAGLIGVMPLTGALILVQWDSSRPSAKKGNPVTV
ncbi:MAG: hypothetical protein ACLFUL_11160 [Desulfobacteraceae bacterium]